MIATEKSTGNPVRIYYVIIKETY